MIDLNPGSAAGNFGAGGTGLMSATSGFSSCSEPSVLNWNEKGLAALPRRSSIS